MRQNDGDLIVTCGASRSGKTAITREETADAQRLIVWDPKGSWAREARCQRVDNMQALLSRICKTPGPLRIALVTPDRGAFDLWAEAAYWWGRLAPCVVVAEEIANVTAPAKAPPGWHLLLSQGLEFGIDIHALTQRPAESDKTAIGNATLLRTFAMRRARDRQYIAAELDIDQADVAKLAELEYIGRNMRNGAMLNARLNFARKSADHEKKAVKKKT